MAARQCGSRRAARAEVGTGEGSDVDAVQTYWSAGYRVDGRRTPARARVSTPVGAAAAGEGDEAGDDEADEEEAALVVGDPDGGVAVGGGDGGGDGDDGGADGVEGAGAGEPGGAGTGEPAAVTRRRDGPAVGEPAGAEVVGGEVTY